jgi:hypothetical protein
MSEVRKAIIAAYAEWTAMSALRSGAPIKSRRDVYTALRGVDFAVLFDFGRDAREGAEESLALRRRTSPCGGPAASVRAAEDQR